MPSSDQQVKACYTRGCTPQAAKRCRSKRHCRTIRSCHYPIPCSRAGNTYIQQGRKAPFVLGICLLYHPSIFLCLLSRQPATAGVCQARRHAGRYGFGRLSRHDHRSEVATDRCGAIGGLLRSPRAVRTGRMPPMRCDIRILRIWPLPSILGCQIVYH